MPADHLLQHVHQTELVQPALRPNSCSSCGSCNVSKEADEQANSSNCDSNSNMQPPKVQMGNGTLNVAYVHDDKSSQMSVVMMPVEKTIEKPPRRRNSKVTFEVTDTDEETNNNVQMDELSSSSGDKDGHLSPAPAYRRPSFARRASVSIGDFRRKSVDVAKLAVNSYRGIILAMISSVFFTLTAVIVKYLQDVHPGTDCLSFQLKSLVLTNCCTFRCFH